MPYIPQQNRDQIMMCSLDSLVAPDSIVRVIDAFGTIKRSMEADYFLLCGLMKTTAEFALFGLGYNLQRALNLLGFKELMRAMAYTI